MIHCGRDLVEKEIYSKWLQYELISGTKKESNFIQMVSSTIKKDHHKSSLLNVALKNVAAVLNYISFEKFLNYKAKIMFEIAWHF